jgi:hypothetical protein
VHPNVTRAVTISGQPGDDAKHYQIRRCDRLLRSPKHERQCKVRKDRGVV